MRVDNLSPVPPLTRITKVLIIACVSIYFVTFILSHTGFLISGMDINEVFGLVPAYVWYRGWVWQVVTYLFLHGPPLHLLLNMLILWYFGSEIEMQLGEKGFLFYFFLCGIGAGLFNLGVSLWLADMVGMGRPIIGASGAIFGILAAYGIFYGDRYFLVFFLFPMKAKYFVLVIAGIELVMGVDASPANNVAHFAHIGGMLIGGAYLYLRYIYPRGGGGKGSKRDSERDKLKKQFTLIVNSDEQKPRGPYWN